MSKGRPIEQRQPVNLQRQKKFRREHRNILREKWKEALASVLPITLIVLALCFFLLPVPNDAMMAFLIGAAMLVVGMGFFTLGTDLAMTPIGEHVGAAMTRSKRLWIVLLISFLVGVVVTVSEPDLQVLAEQVPGVPNMALVLSVAVGVGFFLVVALLRILFRVRMAVLLLGCYAAVFALAQFIPSSFLAVAFDAGGVTTGPMTVPFILALGVGVSSIRSDKNAENDSFGLVALCSVGPILAVMLLSLIYRPGDAAYVSAGLPTAADTQSMAAMFAAALPRYAGEVAVALLPIAVFFFLFQVVSLHLPAREVVRVGAGLLYTYAGLVLFLTGVNVGFMPMGNAIGSLLASLDNRWLLVPVGMLIGYFVVAAEPAVHVLGKQVYELSAGSIPKRALNLSLSIGVSVSVGLAMLRILTGLPILALLIPGYAVALLLMLFVPPIFTSIAFDSGGVASGPMTATFLLPMAMGACAAAGGDVASDAFGVVAMVAMTPLITIQVLGLAFKYKQKKGGAGDASPPAPSSEDIIEL